MHYTLVHSSKADLSFLSLHTISRVATIPCEIVSNLPTVSTVRKSVVAIHT